MKSAKKGYTGSSGGTTLSKEVKYLVIVESPSKCGKIEEYLGSEYKCIASRGHIRHLSGGLKSIRDDFTAEYEPVDEDRIATMRSIISKFDASAILLATDDDREGEAIAWHICIVFGLPIKTTKRIVFHEITRPAILSAVQNPTIINMRLVVSQQARQVLDVLVGYKTSPLLWKYMYHSKDGALSAGRCQTPALRLVYENAQEGKGAVIETRYKTTGYFFEKQIAFSLQHSFKESAEVESFLKESKTFAHTFSLGEKKEIRKGAPKPLNTSRILQLANQKMAASPKETMSLCQTLYQLGFITYMRTDSVKYSGVFLKSVSDYVAARWRNGAEHLSPHLGEMEALANSPHEAIRPTSIACTALPAGVKELDANPRLHTLYKWIWQTTLESCMADARYNTTLITMTAPFAFEYTHLLETPIFLGWQIVQEKEAAVLDKRMIKSSEKTAAQDSAFGFQFYLATLSSKVAPLKWIESVVTATKPHTHYTEASLIQRLEDVGIGRPSTFATIVETIVERGYVKCEDIAGKEYICKEYKWRQGDGDPEVNEIARIFGNEKRKLVIQPLGELVIDFLLEHFDTMFSYDYTKTMESDLDSIVEYEVPEEKREVVCRQCRDLLDETIRSLKNVSKRVYPIPSENGIYEVCFQTYGPVIRQKNVDYSPSLEDSKKYIYHSIKKGLSLDIEKLKRGEYSLDDLMEIKNDCLGKYEGSTVYLKTGKYGPYVECGEIRKSLKSFLEVTGQTLHTITFDQIQDFFQNPMKYEVTTATKQTSGIIRHLNDEMSIRKGKYGAYVFYKRPNMKDPQFFKLKGFPLGYATCPVELLEDWVYQTYNLPRNL